MHYLPWNAFVLPMLDPLFGYPLRDLFREGKPFHRGIYTTMGHESILTCIMRMQCTEHKTLHHWYSGLGFGPTTELEYKNYWDAVDKVPKEDRFVWNMKKHGYKDLCKFLNITDNPYCEKSGLL